VLRDEQDEDGNGPKPYLEFALPFLTSGGRMKKTVSISRDVKVAQISSPTVLTTPHSESARFNTSSGNAEHAATIDTMLTDFLNLKPQD